MGAHRHLSRKGANLCWLRPTPSTIFLPLLKRAFTTTPATLETGLLCKRRESQTHFISNLACLSSASIWALRRFSSGDESEAEDD